MLLGAIWSEFDVLKGSIPSAWTPKKDLSDEILFSVSLRGMSVFSNRPENYSYSRMYATLPLPEFESVAVCTVLYEADVQQEKSFGINLISILIPQVLMEMAWIDLRQIQGVFQEYFEPYQGFPVPDKEAVLRQVASEIDLILERKLNVLRLGEKIRQNLSDFLDSYHLTSLPEEEQYILNTRIHMMLQLLDRVLEAGNHTRIQRALEKMSFILEQELNEELIITQNKTLAQLIHV